MSHSGGEDADRRHLLGNLQLLFQPHAVGDVFDEQQRAAHDGIVARRVLQGHFGGVHEQARGAAIAG